MDFEHLHKHERIILNAVIVGGITMFSILSVGPPSWNVLYAGFVAGILTFLTQVKTLTSDEEKPALLCFI